MKKEGHLSDTEIQQYALGESRIDHTLTSHIEHCPQCSAHVKFYREIARNLSSSTAEVFDFELAPLVLAKLPAKRARKANELVFVIWISAIGMVAGTGLFWYLNAGLLSKIPSNNSAIICGFLLTCGLLFSFLTTNLRREYILKIRQLAGSGHLQQYPDAAV